MSQTYIPREEDSVPGEDLEFDGTVDHAVGEREGGGHEQEVEHKHGWAHTWNMVTCYNNLGESGAGSARTPHHPFPFSHFPPNIIYNIFFDPIIVSNKYKIKFNQKTKWYYFIEF